MGSIDELFGSTRVQHVPQFDVLVYSLLMATSTLCAMSHPSSVTRFQFQLQMGYSVNDFGSSTCTGRSANVSPCL